MAADRPREFEIIEALSEAVNDRDIESLLSLVDPEIVAEPLRAAFQGAFHGHDGIRDFMRDNAESFDVFEISTDDMEMLGDGRVYWEGRVRVVGKDGGPEVLQSAHNVFEFRDGRVSAFKSFPRRAEARRAAGLPD